MRLFRRLVPLFAALLALLVVVQTTDVVACADEATAERGQTHTDVAPGGHPIPAPGDSHDDGHGHDETSLADCLCHIVFTPTAAVPSAETIRVPESTRFASDANRPPPVEPEGPEHVPLS